MLGAGAGLVLLRASAGEPMDRPHPARLQEWMPERCVNLTARVITSLREHGKDGQGQSETPASALKGSLPERVAHR